jgi:hypothetical protein
MTWCWVCPYPFERRKMKWALSPELRDSECTHQTTMWSGKIPKTGVYKCYACGLTLMDPTELWELQRQLSDGLRQMFEEMRNE